MSEATDAPVAPLVAVDAAPARRQSPRCAAHEAVDSYRPCGRCGRFCCLDCLGGSELCSGCRRLAIAGLGNLEGWGRWTARFSAVSAILLAAKLVLVPSLLAAPHARHLGFQLLAGLHALWLVPVGLLYFRWTYLLFKQSRVLGFDPGMTPGWAIGWWFVPIAYLTKPFDGLRTLAGLLNPRQPHRALIDVFQLFSVGHTLLGTFFAMIDKPTADTVITHMATSTLCVGVAGIADAVLTVLLVRALTQSFETVLSRTGDPL